jgi:hypothetical protein
MTELKIADIMDAAIYLPFFERNVSTWIETRLQKPAEK